jgi:hypothetical protein
MLFGVGDILLVRPVLFWSKQMARMTKAEKVRIATENAAKRAIRCEEVRQALEHGCPCCRAKIKRNLSLTGWWQCSQFGAVGFRADATKPSCSWQTFTE